MLYEKDLNSRLDCLHENRPKEEKAPRLLITSDKNKNEQRKRERDTERERKSLRDLREDQRCVLYSPPLLCLCLLL